ncbi:MAG: hypothetical protein H0U18_01600 [Pyrinomonadaceae bacterium]|nr:hypothetical protein [Pyrinomonadaceae bacterium]
MRKSDGDTRCHSLAPEASAEGSRGQALCAPPLGHANNTTRPERAYRVGCQDLEVDRVRIHDAIGVTILCAPSGRGRNVRRNPGAARKRLPLATFCRASGAG